MPTQKHPRYVVCQSTRPGTVRIWNVARVRFKGRPVQVEHGLFSSADIALVRDTPTYQLSLASRTSQLFSPRHLFYCGRRSHLRSAGGSRLLPSVCVPFVGHELPDCVYC
ncbi:uncharacterized protein si:ch211-212k18.6 [Triplophysa rosa]|uniref:uncharacterized protein si:ch211-212k18.6 n=1 Tax=Triplophysa rosa TaxID=992332 RepID=UPI002545E08E|nr:uncharacterized protein si:ch211-212k18.6 [Triplophysa rosa]